MKLRNLLLSVLPFVVSTWALAQMPVGTAKQQITDRLNLSAIADPASPAAGDLWRSSTSADKLKYRSGGTTYTLITEGAAAALYQPLDADLTNIAALSTTSFGRSLLTQADASAARTTLGLVLGTDVQAYSAALASWAGVSRAAGVDTFVATPSSANLRSLVTDETGTGSLYFAGGALGTPSSATLTNATGLPISTGVSGLGTGVATALAATPNATGGVLTYAGLGSVTQAYSANLAAIAGLTSAADRVPYFTGSGTAALATLTSAGRALLDDADAAAQRTTLGLGTGDSPTFVSISLVGAVSALTTASSNLNNTTKESKWVSLHYSSSAEEPMMVAYAFSTSTANEIIFGGGSSSQNAVTRHRFFAAANNTTVSGTEVVSITVAGLSIPLSTASTSTTTGSIVAAGGVGVGGAVNAGGAISGVGGLRITSLPTSASGLSSGDFWNDSGTVKIVP